MNGREAAVEIFVPMIFFLSITAIFFIYFITRNRERMSMIDKGYDPSLLLKSKNKRLGPIMLSIGLTAIGVGLGVVVGFTFANIFHSSFHTWRYNVMMPSDSGFESHVDWIVLPCSLVFGGIGLVSSYLIDKKMNKNQDTLD